MVAVLHRPLSLHPCLDGIAHNRPEACCRMTGLCVSPPLQHLLCSTATSEEHQLAYGQFRSVAVWRKGMDVRVPLTELLEAATPK